MCAVSRSLKCNTFLMITSLTGVCMCVLRVHVCEHEQMKLFGSWRRAADDGGFLSPGGQRRRTIPRGAQFCSIYLQNHINKCCRIVQLLKSKAAWWGGDAKDERSLRRWWHYRRDEAWNLLHMGRKKKWKMWHISSFIPHKYYPPRCPIDEKVWNNKNENLIAFSLCWHGTHLVHTSRVTAEAVPCPLFLSAYIIHFNILHQEKITTQFPMLMQHDIHVHFQT